MNASKPTNARAFLEALRALEERRDVAPLLALYADVCETRSAHDPRPHSGREGAERFWRAYRAAFHKVRSHARAVVEDDSHVLIEWTSRGESIHGAPFEYSGVSVLEIDDDGIRRFCAYFDPGRMTQALNGSLTPAAMEADETSPTGNASAPSGA